MNREELLKAMNDIDDALILRAREERKKKPKIWMTLGTVAACLVVLAAVLPYFTAKKTADSSATTTTGAASGGTAFDYNSSSEACTEITEDTVTEEAGDTEHDTGAPSANVSPSSGVDSDTLAEKRVLHGLVFTLGEETYRIVTDEEELQRYGIKEPASAEKAGEELGKVTLTDPNYELYCHTADMVGSPLSGIAVSGDGKKFCLVNWNDNWYYAVLDMSAKEGK